MKYLTNYMEERQTKLFNDYGVFFAFGNDQLKEGIEKIRTSGILLKGDKVTRCGGGMFVPSKHVNHVNTQLDLIYTESIEQDKAENGKFKIIRRELYNHECFYTGDISDAVEKVKDYGYTFNDVYEVYVKELPNSDC